MDRHSRVLAGGCLVTLMGIVLTASGCRSMRNDVPPGKPYSTTGGGPPPVGFNSDPHPNTSIAPGLYGGTGGPGTSPAEPGPAGPGSTTQFGIPTPGASPYGTPSSNKYGPIPGNVAPPPLNQ
jgi:hypothetical protein